MKKLYILLFALLVSGGATAQPSQPCSACLPLGITFSTQAQINSFQTNYPNCTQIEGDVTITGNINNLNGLIVLTSIGGDLWIHSNIISLTSLTGLNNLTSIGGDLSIGHNALTSLTGLEGLTSIGGGLFIYYNDVLTSLTGLEAITSIEGDIGISANDALTSLTGLDNLTILGGSLDISENHVLNDFTGLEGLTSISSFLEIRANESLTSLTGLENLTSIGDYLYIAGASLTSLTGLDNLTFIGGGLSIYSNAYLTSLTGLDNLTSIGGYLAIGGFYGGNASLTSLTGLDNLTSIGGYLAIGGYYGGNASLTSLAGLGNLTSIGGRLEIYSNDHLTSLTGLDNIDAGSISDIYIRKNALLSTCAIKSICDFIASPNGVVNIHTNATGCDSRDEVDSACVYLSDGTTYALPAFSIYPNPASTTITLELAGISKPYKNTTLAIFNINDQQLLQRQITEQQTVIDVSGLITGIYFVRVISDDGLMVGKFVKQ